MATYAYREQALIELVAETSTARRELSSVSKIGKQFQLDQMKASLQAQSQIDSQSRKTFKNLESDLKNASDVAKKSRNDALKGFQDAAVTTPPESLKGGAFGTPEFAAEHKAQLQAMEGNMNEFRNRMAAMDIDVGTGKTIEEDMQATMGGEADDRKKGLSVMSNMLNLQKENIKQIKTEIDLRGARLASQQKELKVAEKKVEQSANDEKAQRKQIDLQKKILKDTDKRTKAGKAEVQRLKDMEGNLKNIRKVTRGFRKEVVDRKNAIDKEKMSVADLGAQLNETKRANSDLNRTYRTGLDLNKSLSAIESKRLKDEIDSTKKATKANAELNRKKQQQKQLDRDRAVLAKEFNGQIDAMAASFKTTLVTSIAASTAATTAFFNKLNEVNSSFMAFEEELMNAQSIFQASNDTLFGLSDEIVSFGNKYGVSMDNASQGLYTLASAGLDAEESMMVLNNTLKLAMAVQGDHETVAKLTTQTIFGFGLEMEDSAELTDKFAHSINKSLIEYQDLASAVKFAMPFFVSTGQNIDQLLGSLEVLTNRALEAGIAGRGLRQALAEFAQHADDNEAAFRKLGVEIMDAEGNFKMLTEIAKEFQVAMGPAASDVDLMTTLLEDLNVRGATAFVHLVQNADEFEGAVNDLANSAGAATAMADVQQQSLARTVDVLKNSFQSIFIMSDEVGKSNGFINEYAMTLHNVTNQLQGMFVTMEDGVATGLTPLGQTIKDTVIFAMQEFGRLLAEVVDMVKNMNGEGRDFTGMITLMIAPLRLAVKLLGFLGPNFLEAVIILKMLNGILPITNGLIAFNTMLLDKQILMQNLSNMGMLKGTAATMTLGAGFKKLAMSQAGAQLGMLAFVLVIRTFAKESPKLAAAIGAITGALMGYALAAHIAKTATNYPPFMFPAMVIGGMAIMAGAALAIQKLMAAPKVDDFSVGAAGSEGAAKDYSAAIYDTGGRIPMYETGGPKGMGLGSRHQQVMVEPGETIIPKTQNMLGGGGITLNMGDVNVQDGEDFADRVARALPEAIRRQNDAGGI